MSDHERAAGNQIAGTSDQLAALSTPFLDFLGIEVTECGEGRARLTLKVRGEHANLSGITHGGVLATLLDTACGYCGLEPESEQFSGASTITLSIQYLAPAQVSDQLEVIGWRTGGGRRIYFAQAEIHNDRGDTVATASGAFRRASGVSTPSESRRG